MPGKNDFFEQERAWKLIDPEGYKKAIERRDRLAQELFSSLDNPKPNYAHKKIADSMLHAEFENLEYTYYSELNQLLGEVLATLRLPQNAPHIHEDLRKLAEQWNARHREMDRRWFTMIAEKFQLDKEEE